MKASRITARGRSPSPVTSAEKRARSAFWMSVRPDREKMNDSVGMRKMRVAAAERKASEPAPLTNGGENETSGLLCRRGLHNSDGLFLR